MYDKQCESALIVICDPRLTHLISCSANTMPLAPGNDNQNRRAKPVLINQVPTHLHPCFRTHSEHNSDFLSPYLLLHMRVCVCVCVFSIFFLFNFWHWRICSWRSMERPAPMSQAIKQHKYFLPCWHQRLSPGKDSGRLRGMWSNSGRCPWRAELFWVGLCLSTYSQVRLIM